MTQDTPGLWLRPGLFRLLLAAQVGIVVGVPLATQDTAGHYVAVIALLAMVATVILREGMLRRAEGSLRRAAEANAAELAESRFNLIQALESTTDFVIMLDRDWNIAFVNQRAISGPMGGEERGLAVGRNLWELYPEIVGSTFERKYRWAMEHQKPVAFEEYLPTTSKWFDVHAYPSESILSVFFADITERKRAEAELFRLASRDPLTSLHNRRSFRTLFDAVLAQASIASPVAMLYLDVDDFKDINDVHGHPRGDRILRALGERLEAIAADAEIVARVGGDEFVIVSRKVADLHHAERLARSLIADLAATVEVDGEILRLGTSIGIAVAPFHGVDADRLFQDADIALYAAKSSGRRTARLFDEAMAAAQNTRQSLQRELGMALERGEFRLVYQPIVDLERDRVVCFEALIRWRHPYRGEIGPAEFIPVAEETGLIADIGNWVVRTACAAAALWPRQVSVAVNISSAQFRNHGLVEQIAAALRDSGLAPARLELEITETALLQDTEANLRIIRAFRDLGVRIALDDFGTGYSSLAFLNRFPIDRIKIDRSFIGSVGAGADGSAIAQAIIGLGAALRLRVTAEGVETEDQLRFLRDHGCTEAQGYLFGIATDGAGVPAAMERIRRRAAVEADAV